MSENLVSEAIKTNEFFNSKKKQRLLPEEQLDTIKNALIDLYLSVKIRTNEEIDIYDEHKLENERDKLKAQNKVDEITLIDYIKLSIEILMNMKFEDFQKESNLVGKQIKKNLKDKESSHLSVNISNRFMTKSQLSGLSRSSDISMAHDEY